MSEKKLIITKYKNGILTALWQDGEMLELGFESENEEAVLGNIYVGRVQDIVKNINAAFIKFTEQQRGYFPLSECREKLKQGDLLMVQVSRENVKTKAPTLTTKISLPGKYAVLTAKDNRLSFSGKITDSAWKKEIKECCSSFLTKEYGFIIRTNAKEITKEILLSEMTYLARCYDELCRSAKHRPGGTLLYQAPPACITNLRDLYMAELTEILTDDTALFRQIKDYLMRYQSEDTAKLLFYEDSMLSLKARFNIEAAVADALKERVWMKSGAYLVIQPTEALVVIDVNTGKYAGKKNLSETSLYINLEAAKEIAKQLRFRNLSGIIIVDFINMDNEEYQKKLMEHFHAYLKEDPVKTVLEDITRLNLVELTRKKVRKPFYEQLNLREDT